MKLFSFLKCAFALAAVLLPANSPLVADSSDTITLPLRTRDAEDRVHIEKVQVQGSELAVVVMDMWDSHWDPNWVSHAGSRAEAINQFLHRIRAKGGVVIHSPTNLIWGYGGHVYKHTKQCQAAQQAPESTVPPDNGFMPKPSQLCPWGTTRTVGGKAYQMDGKPASNPNLLSNQCIGIDIEAEDYITGEWGTLQEAWNILQKHQTKYVLYVGGATNMCLIAKPIGLRHLKARGIKTVLVRDLAIAWSDPYHWNQRNEKLPESWQYSPLKADAFVADWIESKMSPAVTSDFLSGPVPHTLKLVSATATYSTSRYEVTHAIDGSTTRHNGWGIMDRPGKESSAVFELAEESDNQCSDRLDFVLQFASHDKTCLLGKFRILVTSDDRARFANGQSNNGHVDANWTVLKPTSARTLSTATKLEIGEDGVVTCQTDKTPDFDCFYISADNPLGHKVTALRIDAIPDPSLPEGGPGLSPNGSFVLGEINVRTWRPEEAKSPWELPERKDDFHVFLLMGQSNMSGGGVVQAKDREPTPGVLFIPPKLEDWEPASHPLNRPARGFGLGLSFAKTYQKNHPGVTVGLIPLARGGAEINRLHKGTDVYAEAMKKAGVARKNGVIKGVLWHQGESDTVHEHLSKSYESKLHSLINDVRTDLDDASLPFIVGDLAPEYGMGKAHNAPDYRERIRKVRSVLKSLPAKIPFTGFAASKGGVTSDKVHFIRESYIMLGERYAAAYEKARNDKLTQPKSTGWDAAVASISKMHAADGLEIKLFAAEPMIRQPVTMTVDDRDRVWVIQYLQYPEPAGLKKVSGDRYDRIRYDQVPAPPPHGPRGADRVTILEDTDQDGRADKAVDFVDGLNIASGLALGHGGVWILQSPYLLFYPDRNQDDIPDGDPEARLVGFGLDDAHSVANSLQWGPDGWLYGVHGSTVNANVRGIKFQQGIWRYHPETDRFELFSEGGGNTYGLDFDRYGNAIAGTNFGLPGLHQMQGAYHVKNFGKHGALHNPYTFGYFGHMPHSGTSIGKLSVGGVFYAAEQWPQRFHHKFITANPLNHALYSIDIRPRGSTFTSHFQERLVWSDDPWFQPVDMTIEADGSLLVADWYDGNINYQRTYRNRSNFDPKRGRIYRIVGADSFPKTQSKTHESNIFHPNVHIARRALQKLAEQGDPSLATKFAEQLTNADNEERAVRSLWSLNLCQSLDSNEKLAILGLQHHFPMVRAWTVRLLGDHNQVSTSIAKQLILMAGIDSDVRVLSQLACTAKRLPAKDCLAITSQLAKQSKHTADSYFPLLLWWAVESKSVSHRNLILEWLGNPDAWRQPLMSQTIIPRLARRYTAEDNDIGFETCAQLLALAPLSRDVERVIGGMEQQLQGLKQGKVPDALREPLAKLWKRKDHPLSLVLFTLRMGSDAALSEATSRIKDPSVPQADRIRLIDTIGQTTHQAALPTLLDLLQPANKDPIRSSVLTAIARYNVPEVGSQIIKHYTGFPKQLRDEARQILYSRAIWTTQFLESIDRKDLSPSEIPYQELPSLQTHSTPTIRNLLRKHWGSIRSNTLQEKRDRMLEVGRIVLADTGNPELGKTHFTTRCGICHRFQGEGQAIGPDLTPYPRHDLSYLLLHIIDPNAVIRPEYQMVTIHTKDGRVLAGPLTESTPQTRTLIDLQGKRIIIAREDIQQLKESDVSLMPERLLSTLKPIEVRDLFAYLRSNTTEPLSNDLTSLSGRHESFDSPSKSWQIVDNGSVSSPEHQSNGGHPGGWLQLNDASGGRMAIDLPKSWLAELQRNNGGILSFDARTVDPKNGRPHADFGLIEITGAGRTLRVDVATSKPNVPSINWTNYSVSLEAKTFRISDADWQNVLKNLTSILIRLEGYAGANEVMGLDNLSLRSR